MRREGNEHGGFVIGNGPMREVFARLRKVAPVDTTVLLLGESGTGKEVAARWLHDYHPVRRRGPFVCVHCGAIPESLLESELFGHVRGAFTGADRDRAGVFEQAQGGTLFLDEISTMSAQAQVRLLRILQERTVTRIGSTRPAAVDVRVVVATNENLREGVERGTFRRDLYYRVGVFPLVLPPLRDRMGDVCDLAETLGARVAGRLGSSRSKSISDEALGVLRAHSWPGNVRELENAVEHAYILAQGRDEILREDLPPEIANLPPAMSGNPVGVQLSEDGISFRAAVTNLERDLILQSLQLAEGNKARAAELLGLKRTTFLEKLRRVEPDEPALFAQPDRSSPAPGREG